MLVTPRLVSWSRVLLTETKLTSAIGTTPTTSKAARTFCQNRIRGRRISPALRDGPHSSWRPYARVSLVRFHQADQSWNGRRSYRKGPSTRSGGAAPPAPATRLECSATSRQTSQRTCPVRTWRTSGHRDDQKARRRSRLRLHPDGGRLRHLLPPLAGGERRVRYAARRAVRELREGHGPPPRQAAGGESQPSLRGLRPSDPRRRP